MITFDNVGLKYLCFTSVKYFLSCLGVTRKNDQFWVSPPTTKHHLSLDALEDDVTGKV